MHAWETIERSLDFIEEHLEEEIKIEALADTAALSPFYFQRLFKRLVHKPIQEYIKLRRLARASDALRDTERRILDVAIDYGFSSHANFTRAFKDAYAITPEEYRRTLPMLNTFDRPEVSANYVLFGEGVPLVVGDIVLEIERKTLTAPEAYIGFETAVSIAAQMPVGESTGVDIPGQLWRRYHAERASIASGVHTGAELGMSHSADPKLGTFRYFAGGLAKSGPGPLPDGMVLRELPAGEYAVCKVEAEDFETLVTVALNQASRYLFGTWLPQHNLITAPFSAEKYYRDAEGAAYMELWVMPIPMSATDKDGVR